MSKYLISILIIIALAPAVVLGQSSNADCGMVDSSTPDINIFGSIDGKYVDLLPEDAQERVSKNLRAYCCQQNILKEKTCEKTKTDIPPEGYYPQSTYLFDHIIDVMLRRLDGNVDLIYPDVALDPTGEEWRDKIREQASVPEWSTPMKILNIAKDYRIKQSPSDTQTPRLLWLYNRVCPDAYGIYEAKVAGAKGITNTPWALPTSRNQDVCALLAQQRIQYELKYIGVIMNMTANRTLETYMEKHLGTYFVTTRLAQLQSTISQMVDSFQTVNRFIVEGTKQCSM